MSENAYKMIEIVGLSEKSYAEATKNAVAEAAKTMRGMAWFEVSELRGAIKDSKISQFQVKVKIAFKVERD